MSSKIEPCGVNLPGGGTVHYVDWPCRNTDLIDALRAEVERLRTIQTELSAERQIAMRSRIMDTKSEPHEPSAKCVDTCDNPYVCRDEWEAKQDAKPWTELEMREHDVAALAQWVDELKAENERLRTALEKHHDLLSDEPGDNCQTCGTTWDGALVRI